MRDIRREVNAGHMLNDMHDEWSIGVVLHHILTSDEDLIPNIMEKLVNSSPKQSRTTYESSWRLVESPILGYKI